MTDHANAILGSADGGNLPPDCRSSREQWADAYYALRAEIARKTEQCATLEAKGGRVNLVIEEFMWDNGLKDHTDSLLLALDAARKIGEERNG